MAFLLNILLFLSFTAFAAKRLLIYLHALQQDDYDNKRLLVWIWKHKVFDLRLTLLILATFALPAYISPNICRLLAVFAFSYTAYVDIDPRKRSKKKLVMTSRAKRIYFPALFMAGVLGLTVFVLDKGVLWDILLIIQIPPLLLIASNLLNMPYEKKVQKKFYDEAVAKLSEINPTIIGITGSFGKTSVKHILGHILKTAAPTLITPGSVNTVMGITRIIRERMEPNTKYFVSEMGAYGPGSIKRLCALTPPDAAIIIAIGHAHYERFKTLETVAEAKYELAEDTLSRGGHVTVHQQTLGFPASKAIYEAHKDRFTVCGEQDDPDIDLEIKSIEQTKDGLVVVVVWEGKDYTLKAPLYGLHHGSNMAISFSAAAKLGIAPEDIITALSRCPQITHRLEVKRISDGSILIDDAFNSNPNGFKAGLELLPVLKDDGGRSILITPGMVELGPAHDEEHRKIAAVAAQTCDVVLAVCAERIPSFVATFKEQAPDKELLEFATFKDAEAWLVANRKSGDVVLIENDLPDLYEQVPRL